MMSKNWLRASAAVALAILLVAYGTARSRAADHAKSQQQREEIVRKALGYLGSKGQAANGSFSEQAGPAVTAIVVTGLIENGRAPNDPVVAKGLKYLEGFVRDSGGIYADGSRIKNYDTCVNLLAFKAANRDKRYDKIIANADAFLRGLQAGGTKGKEKSDIEFGGVGYGDAGRPDLSNTAFLVDALQAAGASPDDQAIKDALVFISRCQNLETENNTTPFAAKNPDGGFYYTPAAGGSDPAGTTENGGLRSYGSMTYAGLKSMIFAGLGPDDPRVKAAVEWAKKNYDLESNPGLGSAGLYYYYQLLAKALEAMQIDTFVDEKGQSHDWRSELIAELGKRQQPDGSWVNDNKKWLEGDANLVTGFALLALSHTRPPQK